MHIHIYIIVTLHNTTEAIKVAVVETKYNINIIILIVLDTYRLAMKMQ